jgi:hypothetical protein
MEDLKRSSVRFGSVLEQMSVDDVAALLSSTAVLHAEHWESEWLSTAGWLENLADPGCKSRQYASMLGPAAVAQFLADPARKAVIPEALREPSLVVKLFWASVEMSGRGPQVLLHGDLHVGNVYFDDGQPGLCDWQLVTRGSPAFDVAYLLGSALDTASRGHREHDLLKHYLDALKCEGVQAIPSFNDMWNHYRAQMAYGYFAWLTTPQAFQPSAVIVEVLRRFTAAIVELETGDALGCRT